VTPIQTPDCPAEVCPLRDTEQLEAIKAQIAHEGSRRWWEGFPWPLVVAFLLVVSSLVSYGWVQMDQRVARIEAFVSAQTATNARRDVVLAQLSSDIGEIKALLKARESEADKQVRENALMIRRIMRRLGVPE
jgi:hypothetical protein